MEILELSNRNSYLEKKTDPECLFDPIRQSWVISTPEERVRQKVLKEMVEKLEYPPSLLAVEKDLKQLPHITQNNFPKRRVDILAFGRSIHHHFPLYPLILIECKSNHQITPKVLQQVIAYNDFVGAYIVALATPKGVFCGEFDHEAGHFRFSENFPSYSTLINRYRIEI